MMPAARLRLIQKSVHDTDLVAHLRAAEWDAIDLLIFPELATTGCLYVPREIPSAAELLDPLRSSTVRVMIGTPVFENGQYFNRLYYLHGEVTHFYTKNNLFPGMNETSVYKPGTQPGLFDTDLGRIGVAICYDLRFPDYFVRLKSHKPDFVVVSAAWPKVRIGDWERILAERAVELGVPVIGVNAVGDDGTNDFGGSSRVVDQSGTTILVAEYTQRGSFANWSYQIGS